MKNLIDVLKSCRSALALASFISALFVAATTLAFSQVTFEKLWEEELSQPEKWISYPYFSKNGEYIYVAGEYTLMKYDVSNGLFIKYLDKSSFPNMYKTIDMAISPKGTFLMSHDGSTGIYLWDTKTDKACRFIPQSAYGLIMTPDEKYMILGFNEGQQPKTPPGSGNSNLCIYDVEKDTIIKSIHSWGRNELLALSSDGKYLATVAYKNESESLSPDSVKACQKVILWNTDTWIPTYIDSLLWYNGGELNSGWDIRFSDDNKYIYWRTQNYRINKIYNVEARKIISFSNPNKDCYRVVFLPDSLTYGFCYPEMEIFDLESNKPLGVCNYNFYGWAEYPTKHLILGKGFSKGSLFEVKNINSVPDYNQNLITVNYSNAQLILHFNEIVSTPLSISIFTIDGKEVYKLSDIAINIKDKVIPVMLNPGIFIVNISLNESHFFQTIKVTR